VSTVVDILKRTESYFRDKGIPSPRLDAELILGHHLKLDRVGLYLQFDRSLNESELGPIREHVRQRATREPLAWVLGTKGFHDIELAVHRGVLVPRPDTETLVEAALALIPEDEALFIADICCGSGAVGLAIASARPLVKVFATDIDPIALRCTKENVKRLGLTGRVAVLRGSLLEPIPTERQIDILVANPPYVASAEIDGLEPEVATHEPRAALDGGADGLDIYRKLIPEAAKRATRAVLVEIGCTQAKAVSALMTEAGLHEIQSHPDLGGHDRVISGARLPEDRRPSEA
jgi:release factor glutamine methyltransferase